MLEEIMAKIKAELTGDIGMDMLYLDKQAIKYQDHELGDAIKKECEKIALDRLMEHNLSEDCPVGIISPSDNYDDIIEAADQIGAYLYAQQESQEFRKMLSKSWKAFRAAKKKEENKITSFLPSAKNEDPFIKKMADPKNFMPEEVSFNSFHFTINDRKAEIEELIDAGKLEEAEAASRKLLEDMEEDGMISEDENKQYLNFREHFEKILYDYYFPSLKESTLAVIDYSSIFVDYGNLLFEMNRLDEAEKMLERAIRWNPVNCDVRYEHAEIFKVRNDLEKFFEYTCKALKLAFKVEDLARGYKNLGYYFTAREKYMEAAICYKISIGYDLDIELLDDELQYIEDKSGIVLSEVSVDEVPGIAGKHGFPGLVNEEILDLMLKIGEEAAAEGEYEEALYHFSLLYDLTAGEDVKERFLEIEALNNEE